jgi:glycosyltransferase involved in cell wall biosynthesis
MVMKPYLLVTGDFVRTGGMDRANFALADYLARQGGEVHLVAHRVDPQLLSYSNVQFHRVPKIANSYFLSSFRLNLVGQYWAQRVTRQGGRVIVNGGNCQWGDVNWVHYVHAAYCPDSPRGWLRTIKSHIAHRVFLQAEQQALRAAQVIIANSNRTKQDLIERLGLPENRIHTVYYGNDPTVFYPASPKERLSLRQQFGWDLTKPIVVFIGALGDRRKGFDTLFLAWQKLCADPNWDADLVVIGTGAELPRWQQRAVEAGVSDRISFLGFRSDVPNLLRAADCLVAPTRYEAYGLGVHEALCCGLPAIVSASAGVSERYPQQLNNLFLSNPEDAESLATLIYYWKKDIELYRQSVEFFSKQMQSYSWDTMTANILRKLCIQMA